MERKGKKKGETYMGYGDYQLLLSPYRMSEQPLSKHSTHIHSEERTNDNIRYTRITFNSRRRLRSLLASSLRAILNASQSLPHTDQGLCAELFALSKGHHAAAGEGTYGAH